MSTKLMDQRQEKATGRAWRYLRLDRVRAGESAHPAIRTLERRRRKVGTDLSRVRQFLRIERGNLT